MKKSTNSKKQVIQKASGYGILVAFMLFVYDIYRYCYENISITISEVNFVLLKSVVIGLALSVFMFFFGKNLKTEQSEKVIPIQKLCGTVSFCAALTVIGGTILYFNHWQFAYIVLWLSVLMFIAAFAIVFIYYFIKKKNKG